MSVCLCVVAVLIHPFLPATSGTPVFSHCTIGSALAYPRPDVVVGLDGSQEIGASASLHNNSALMDFQLDEESLISAQLNGLNYFSHVKPYVQ